MIRAGLALAAAALALAGCATGGSGGGAGDLAASPPVTEDERAAIAARLTRDIAILASDGFGGRRPGTPGEEKTLAFIESEWRAAGLTPGTGDPAGGWRAPVPLAAISAGESRVALQGRDGRVEFSSDEAIAITERGRALVEGGALVFVGRLGDEVPRAAVAGKVVLMLGEPGVSPGRRASLLEKDPAAVLTVVADRAAIARTRRSLARERIRPAAEDSGRLTGFVTQSAMMRALGKAGWDALLAAAEEDGFEPTRLDHAATIEARANRRLFTSYNLVGKLPGRDPQAGALLLLAHWDHLGECGAPQAEDRLCNGAVDNASGVAAMTELARRLAQSGPHDRTIYVLATSAEESGLLGARAFVANPPLPLDSIIGAFNFDTVAVAPAGSPVGFVGEGRTVLDDLVRDAIERSGRKIGDPRFAEEYVQRQDGWALLEAGVPAVLVSSSFASEITLSPYLASAYHRASDEAGTLELGGAIDDLLLHETLLRRLADIAAYSPRPRGRNRD